MRLPIIRANVLFNFVQQLKHIELLGGITTLFPDRIIGFFERLAIENPEECSIRSSLSVLVERSGPLEITAIVAIVVTTRGVMIWHQQSGPRWRKECERVRSPRDWSLGRREWAVLVGGYLLLAIANYREALAIAGIAG